MNDFSGGKNLKLLEELQNYYKKNKIKEITDGDISDLIIHQMKEQNIDYDKEDTIKILKNQTEINIDQTVIKSTLNTPRPTRTDSIRKTLKSPQNNIKLGTNKTRSASVAHNQNKQILSQTPQPKKTNIVNNEIEQPISQTPQPKTMSIVGQIYKK